MTASKPLVFSLILAFGLTYLMLFVPKTTAYNITYIGNDHGGTELKARIPSMYYTSNCDVDFALRYTASHSTTYSLINEYISPFETSIVATSTPIYPSNVNCRPDSPALSGGSSLNDFYSASVNSTTTATSLNTWIEGTYTCDSVNEKFIMNSTGANTDNYGNLPYAYGYVVDRYFGTSGSNNINSEEYLNRTLNHLEGSYYENCGANMDIINTSSFMSVSSCGGLPRDLELEIFTMIPFNSMPSGRVNISVYDRAAYQHYGGTIQFQNHYYLWDPGTNGTIDLGTDYPYNGELILTPDTDYWLLIGQRNFIDNYNCGTGPMDVYHNYTAYSISIWDYSPAWECGEYGECVENIKSRVCEDPAGKIPDKIEYRQCALGVIENASIGFEESESRIVTMCKPTYQILDIFDYGGVQFLSCDYDPVNVTTQKPLNWTVPDIFEHPNYSRYFLDMTNEWATEGSRSLKMWTIPPKQYEPEVVGTPVEVLECFNSSLQHGPDIWTNISNASASIEFNVTFPAENMRLSFDVAKCEEQVIQNGELWQQLPFTQFNYSLVCPKVCYSTNCSEPPKGAFQFDIWDYANGSSLLGVSQYYSIEDDLTIAEILKRRLLGIPSFSLARTLEFDLSEMDIHPGVNYSIRFGVYNQDPFDTSGNCIMLDNVRYDVLDTPFVSILPNQECSSTCLNGDYYQAKELSSGACRIVKYVDSPNCYQDSTAEKIENLEDFCVGDVLHHVNSFSRQYEEIDCDYGCSEGHCLTQEEAEDLAEEEESTAGYFDLGIWSILFSPVFWGMIAMLILSGFIARISKTPPIGIIAALGISLVFWLGGIFPDLIGITIIIGILVIASFVFTRMLLGRK